MDKSLVVERHVFKCDTKQQGITETHKSIFLFVQFSGSEKWKGLPKLPQENVC